MAFAQNLTPDPVIKVTVDLVQVDAIVTDAEGHHVTGLKPEDFRILEDGKAQTITAFAYSGETHAPQSPLPIPPKMAAVKPDAPPRFAAEPLRLNQVRRTIVLIADDLGF